MKPEAQRIAIAEACGYRPATPGALGVLRWHDPHHQNGDLGNGICYIDELPDYLNDLNAMHQAEKVLSRGKNYYQLGGFGFYLKTLGQIIYQSSCVDSTAAQRAETFLRTLGKWKEASQ
jgi:hypothetical protein